MSDNGEDNNKNDSSDDEKPDDEKNFTDEENTDYDEVQPPPQENDDDPYDEDPINQSETEINKEIEHRTSPLKDMLSDEADEEEQMKTVYEAQIDNDNNDGIEFIKPPIKKEDLGAWDLDDLMNEAEFDDDDDDHILKLKPTESLASIHLSDLQVTSVEEARTIAEFVIETLEEDLARFMESEGIEFETESDPGSRIPREKVSGSSISISSNISDPLPGEPSTLRLFYAKGITNLKTQSIPHIKEPGVDEMCEVNLHRSRKDNKPQKVDGIAQTRQMTFVTDVKAQLEFMHLYPKPDDWTPPEVPTRVNSMQFAVDAAEKEDPNVDRSRKDPQIINFSNRKKLLQPLREDYYKDETFWTGSRFRGEYKNRQFHKGHYDHPTGVKYESEWKDGHFHTSKHLGVMIYPRGDTFEGEWRKGRYISGQITFGDGLQYKSRNWTYCEPPDRRLRIEKYYGLKPAGNAIYNDQYPAPKLPPGCYDVGDGVYNPTNAEIRGYDGFFLRTASPTEQAWILKYCRRAANEDEDYIPSFHADRIPGCYMEQLQRFSMAKRKYH